MERTRRIQKPELAPVPDEPPDPRPLDEPSLSRTITKPEKRGITVSLADSGHAAEFLEYVAKLIRRGETITITVE